MHYVGALAAFAALILYANRSGWLVVHGTQSPWALITRAGVGGVLATLCVGFFDIALAGGPFVWRHWLILAALVLTVVGHLGLARGGPSDPT